MITKITGMLSSSSSVVVLLVVVILLVLLQGEAEEHHNDDDVIMVFATNPDRTWSMKTPPKGISAVPVRHNPVPSTLYIWVESPLG